MGAQNLTTFDPVLKSHYVKKKVAMLADLKAPFAGMVKRNDKAGGKHIVQPIDFENPRGGSATISKALANLNPSLYEDFVLTRTKNYQIANIDNETIEASMSDENAFVKALGETDKAFKAAGRRDAWQMYRTLGGAKGVIGASTTVTTAVCVLSDAADAFNFQKGELCTFAAADGTGSERNSGGTLTVSSIDRENGEITFTANIDTNTGTVAGDYIFAEGDFGLNMAGLASWLPIDRTVLTTSFYGVTRSDDEDRLGGIYRNSVGEPIDEALIKLTGSIGKHGGMPDVAFVNPETLTDLDLILGSKVRYAEVKGRAGIGFKGITVSAGGHEVKVFGDVNCPTNRLYVLTLDTWTLHSAGGTPKFLNRDGLLMRSATADEYECRIGSYRNLGCCAPSYNGVAQLA